MSRIHVMDAVGPENYRIVVHAPTPGGNNAANVPWVTALASLGRVTQMEVGTDPGKISAAEANQIALGQVVEANGVFTDDPSWTNPQRVAALNAYATQLVSETQAELQRRLKFFGHEVT